MKVIALEGSALTVPELEKLVKQGPVVLTRNGLPLMTVTDATSSDWEAITIQPKPRFVSLIAESRQSYAESGGIALEAIRRELDADPEDASPSAAVGN
jgi:hypothetical protein